MSDQDSQTQTILCLKWGNRYGSDYVNRLYSMAKRNTSRPLRVVCFTDDPTGIRDQAEQGQHASGGHPGRQQHAADGRDIEIAGPGPGRHRTAGRPGSSGPVAASVSTPAREARW